MRIVMTEEMRKKAENGKSVLKFCRTHRGAAKGAMGAGITLLVFALFSGLPFLLQGMPGGALIMGILGVPGLFFLGIGGFLQAKRAREYLKFYEKESGYDQSVLMQAEQELLMPQTVAVGNRTGFNKKQAIHCYITENFLVSVTTYEACYVRRLSDLTAAFYSEKIPGEEEYIQGMVFISRQDIAREPRTNPYTYRQCGGYINALLDKESCAQVAEEIAKRNPSVITNQIFSDGKKEYDLLSMDHWEEDWKEIGRAR